MTEKDTSQETRQKFPEELAICRWALAAGLAGHSLQISFQGFPIPVVGKLFQICARWGGPDRVHAVYGLRDFQTLAERFDEFRIVFVFEHRLAVKIAWLVAQRNDNSRECPRPGPAVFASQASFGSEDDPGATLVLHGHPERVKAITDWLRTPAKKDFVLPKCPPAQIQFDPRLEELFWPVGPEAATGLQRYRDCQILQGLLVGAAFLREYSRRQPRKRVDVSIEDYCAVFGVIRLASFRPGDQPFDPLAIAMVNRANAYVKMRDEKVTEPDKVARLTRTQPVAVQREGLITRREVWNLGNPKGGAVRRLVEHLVACGAKGFETFRKLGTIRPLEKNGNWSGVDAKSIAGLLIPWSDKQVRDHFHRLYREGLITALPRPGNKPWTYVIPEMLSDPSSPFKSLPDPEILAAAPAKTPSAHR